MLDAGNPPKVAITAIMRKLVVLANALVQSRIACGRRNHLRRPDGYPASLPPRASPRRRDSPGQLAT